MNAYTFQLKNDKTGAVKVLGDREILPDIFDGHHKLDLFYLNQYDRSFRDYADFLEWRESLRNPVELPKYTGIIISDETCMPLGEISNLSTVDQALFENNHLDIFGQKGHVISFDNYSDFLEWWISPNPAEDFKSIEPKADTGKEIDRNSQSALCSADTKSSLYSGVILSRAEAVIARVHDLSTICPALFNEHTLDVLKNGFHFIYFDNYTDFVIWWRAENIPIDNETVANRAPKSIASAVDPDHYKGYLGDLQWLEAMNRMSRFQNDPKIFMGAVELQARKYLDRLGEKDNEAQEILKAVWYLRYLAAYVINGKQPIRVEDIDKLIDSVK